MKITDSTTIISKDNPRLKLARAVRDGREKGMIYLEGARLVSELMRGGPKAQSVFVSSDLAGKFDQMISELARSTGAEVFDVAANVFNSITDTDNSQGLVVLAERPEQRRIEDLAHETGFLIYLSRISNPSNLGALVRTAEAAGTAGLITSPGSADPYSPKALRASMGSALRLPIFTDIGIEEAIDLARDSGIRSFAADIRAHRSYTDADWRSPAMLVFGSEAHGLSAHELAIVDEVVHIPMENSVESLNLAVSAGILLFEAKRQRGIA